MTARDTPIAMYVGAEKVLMRCPDWPTCEVRFLVDRQGIGLDGADLTEPVESAYPCPGCRRNLVVVELP